MKTPPMPKFYAQVVCSNPELAEMVFPAANRGGDGVKDLELAGWAGAG